MSAAAVLDYCAQPSATAPAAKPMPLRTVFLTVDEFNQLAASTDQPTEALSPSYRQIVTTDVRYVVELVEVA